MVRMTKLKNPSFENGWTDIVTGEDLGWLINQQPIDWHLRWLNIGESLFGSDEARGVPECVHKMTNQLPPNEQPGGSDPLILDGEHTYKIFHNGAAFGAELWQIVEGLEPGTVAKVTVPVRIHAHGEKDNPDQHAAESGVWGLDDWAVEGDLLAPLNGNGSWVPLTRERQWRYIGGVKPDGWVWYYHEEEITVPENGAICVLVRVKSKWDKPVDFFIDALAFEATPADGGTEPPIEPPSDLEQRVAALELRVSALEADSHTHDTTTPPIEPPEPTPTGLGMDVSHWNGYVNWNESKAAGIEYAIMKATEGISFVDSRFGENWGESKAAGIPRSAYHYFRFGIDPIEQANHFWHVVGKLGDIPHVIDVEDTKQPADITAVKSFIDRYVELSGQKPMIYTGAWFWNNARWGGPVGWAKDYLLWVANYTTASSPVIPTDWDTWHIWQYTGTADGPSYGASSKNLDLNRTNQDEPEPRPSGEKYNTDFMIPDPRSWVVVDRGEHGGEDIYHLQTSDEMVRVKNRTQGEWYSANGRYRFRDTSPADDPNFGECLYLQYTDKAMTTPGGQIAPEVAEVGVTYEFWSQVQFKTKDGCQNLSYRSGWARSTFRLDAVHHNYTFANGVTVDILYETTQTGEKQLYAVKDGIKRGWCGGGAVQHDNVWGAMPQEFYLGRAIPQEMPPTYCS